MAGAKRRRSRCALNAGLGPSPLGRDDANDEKDGWKSWLRLHSLRKLSCKNVNFLNNRWLGKQLGSLCHQGCRDLARKVGLPARLIREGVEDPEGRRPQTDPKPCSGCRFLLGERQTSTEKAFDLRFFPRSCFQTNEQGYCDHDIPPIGYNANNIHCLRRRT